MADSKLADLTTATSLAGDEYVYVVDDPSGTPVDRKATVDTLMVPPPQLFKSTYYYRTASATTPFAQTQSELRALPFWVPHTTTFDRVGVENTIVAASSVSRLGIYSDDGTGQPGALLVEFGSTINQASGTGFKELTISQQLARGLYWLAAVSQGGAPTMRLQQVGFPFVKGSQSPAGTTGVWISPTRGSVTGSLPDPFGATGESTAAIAVWLRAA